MLRLARNGFLCAFVALTACDLPDPAVGDCRAIRARYANHTDDQLLTLDMETQYRVYICQNQGNGIHGGGAHRLALEGEEMAQFLAPKLEATDNDLTVLNILVVFAMMQSNGAFDATTDPDLIALMERKVDDIDAPRSRAVREQAERYLRAIKEGPYTPLP